MTFNKEYQKALSGMGNEHLKFEIKIQNQTEIMFRNSSHLQMAK